MRLPFDHSFKIISDDDPRALLAAFAGIPLDVPLTVTPLDSELNTPALRVDKLYQCTRPGQPSFLIHFEAVASFKAETIDKQMSYIHAIVLKHSLPVRSYLLLLRKDGVPDKLPRWYHRDFNDLQTRVRIRIVRVWRLPAQRLLKLQRAVLYPWTVLAKSGAYEVSEAALRLREGNYEDYFLLLQTLCGLQYGKDNPFVQELNRMPMEEVLQESTFYQKLTAKWNETVEAGHAKGQVEGRVVGRLEGRMEGRAEGRVDGHRDALIRVLETRFGPLPAQISHRIATANDDELSALLGLAATAPTLDAVFLAS